MMRKLKAQLYVHLFFLCTVLAVLLILPAKRLSFLLFSVGANSIYIALAYFLFSENGIATIISLLWIVLFSCALILAYLCSVIRKNNYPFVLLVWVDLSMVLTCGILELMTGNNYGFTCVLPDAIISLMFCTLLTISCRKQ